MRWNKLRLDGGNGQRIYDPVCFLVSCILVLIVTGCRAPGVAERAESPPHPVQEPQKPPEEFFVRVGSIDLSSFPRKIEKSDIKKFSAQLQKDTLDMLIIQGITRYPGLENRADVVDELAAASEMNAAFGETMTLSGRQSGNAVFSHYPIRSHESTQYNGLRSTRFESALQAIIDCGEREIVAVSTQLPEKMTADEQTSIVSTLGGFSAYYPGMPIIISGNLRIPNTFRSGIFYNALPDDGDKSTPAMWYSNDGSLVSAGSKTNETALGRLLSARFKIAPPPRP